MRIKHGRSRRAKRICLGLKARVHRMGLLYGVYVLQDWPSGHRCLWEGKAEHAGVLAADIAPVGMVRIHGEWN